MKLKKQNTKNIYKNSGLMNKMLKKNEKATKTKTDRNNYIFKIFDSSKAALSGFFKQSVSQKQEKISVEEDLFSC